VAGSFRSFEDSKDLIGNRTHDLPACNLVPQPTTLPRAPKYIIYEIQSQIDEYNIHYFISNGKAYLI
jgi:hypothetical protein